MHRLQPKAAGLHQPPAINLNEAGIYSGYPRDSNTAS